MLHLSCDSKIILLQKCKKKKDQIENLIKKSIKFFKNLVKKWLSENCSKEVFSLRTLHTQMCKWFLWTMQAFYERRSPWFFLRSIQVNYLKRKLEKLKVWFDSYQQRNESVIEPEWRCIWPFLRDSQERILRNRGILQRSHETLRIGVDLWRDH